MHKKENSGQRMNILQINALNTDDDEDRKGKIIQGVNYDLRDYEKFIEVSKKVLHESDAIDVLVERREVVISKDANKKEIRYYVLFDKMNNKKSEKIENKLFGNQENQIYKKKPTGNFSKDKNEELDFKVNKEEQYLILGKDYGDLKVIYLKANDYQLNMQLKAVQKLRNSPMPYHTPLLKLFDIAWRSKEYFKSNVENDFVDINDFKILGDDNYDGTTEQRDFVNKALKTKDFALLEGPPGSGKTTAIIELIIQLAKQGKRVLLVSATHVAVDNVIDRLLTKDKDKCNGLVAPIRIASSIDQISKESVKPYVYKTYKNKIKKEITNNLRNKASASSKMFQENLKVGGDSGFDDIILNSANVVGGTMIGILQHPSIKKQNLQEAFDVMIVDEASKVTFLDFLVPALYAKRWILIGDVNQLPPYTEDDYINENIDKVIEDKNVKEDLVKSYDLNCKLNSDRKWDKESVKVFFTDNSVFFKKQYEKNYDVFELTKSFNKEKDVFKLNGADIIIANKSIEAKRILTDYLFVKALFFEGEIRDASFNNLQKGFHNKRNKFRNPKNNIENYPFEFLNKKDKEWKQLVGEKLCRMYEYRFSPEQNEKFKDEYDYLVPEKYQGNIEKIRRLALPSMLELLQIGVGVRVNEDVSRQGKLLHRGFNALGKDIKEPRFQSLEYQHRMHTDIARIPREYFYEGKNLTTANTVIKREEKGFYLDYKESEKRVIWVSNNHKLQRKNGIAINKNPEEVTAIKNELIAFVKAVKNKKKKFSVAVLSFYRAQEFELRTMLREFTGQKNSTKFSNINNVEITLCTVDKFQGDEADMVLLSFTKSTKGAFYNSPNRLNVALTRARYKLVLYGNKKWLSDNSPLKALRKLAEEEQERLTSSN